jgi:branched-chain amino acid transport system substrate-binding protein
MNKYMPGADQTDLSYVYAYGAAQTMLVVLRQCNGNFSRENIMKQATNIKDLVLGVALPGIKVNTSPTNFHPIKAMQMIRWDGKTWAPVGEIIEGSST